MRRLREEIADTVNGKKADVKKPCMQKIKTPAVTACKACGNIV
jgi:hypothetical protein